MRKKPPRPQNVPLDDVENLEDLEVGVGPEPVGVHFVKKVARIMSHIPSKEDWVKMEKVELNDMMQKCAEHWGHVSITLVSS